MKMSRLLKEEKRKREKPYRPIYSMHAIRVDIDILIICRCLGTSLYGDELSVTRSNEMAQESNLRKMTT